jgi:hypothetical protein
MESAKIWFSHSDTILWQVWLTNGHQALSYLAQNLSPIVFVAVCLGAGLAIIQRRREEFLLLTVACIIIAAIVIPANPGDWFPRYLLPAVPFLLLLAVRAIEVVVNKLSEYLFSRWSPIIVVGLVLIIILPGLWFDYWLIADPAQAPFVEIDRWQYVNGWPSGYGFYETAVYLRNQLSQSEKIIVVYDNPPKTKLIPRALQIYLYDLKDRITYTTFDFEQEDYDHLVQYLSEQQVPVFVVLDYPTHKRLDVAFDTSPYTQSATRFLKPDGRSGVDVYLASYEFGN